MIHIVFNEPDVKVLNAAQALDETLAGEIVLIKDDYAVGPIQDIYSEEGKTTRKNWWRKVLEGSDLAASTEDGSVDDNATVASLKEKLEANDEEEIWIWAAQNKHDVSGYFWLMTQLKDFAGRIQILYLNNLPFFHEKGNIFYPQWLSEIPAKEFLKAKKLAREVTLSEFETDPDEWEKLSQENGGVRLLEGGKKLVSKNEDFYDGELKKLISGDWQKASKIINQHLTKATHTTGDAYLLWRLKEMVSSDELDMQGNMANMKDFELKQKSTPTTEA
ncbi:MAG: DUF3658 domain-containing protein [Ferruginibacter sp.]